MYIYVGSLMCSGKLDNGNDWKGLRLAAGVVMPGKHEPYAVKIYKVVNDEGVHADIESLAYSEPFNMTFDEKGRVVNVESLL